MPWRSHIPLGLAIAFIVVAPAIFGSFTITLMNYIGIYAFAVLGLVLLTGVGGLTSFGQAAFVGIGAYATAWYTAVQGGSPWIGLLLALLLTGLVATVLGAATLRLGGHFLPLSTIAWGIAIFFLFGNIDAIGRYSGLSGIPAITIGPISLGGNVAMYCFIWGLLGIVMLLCRNLLDSRKGRAIRSLRGGIAMVESLAIDSFRMRLAIFVFAGMLAGLSGWLYAHMQRYVSPAPFDVRPSIELLLMALVGGAGHIAGAVVGAAVITLLKNTLQDILPVFTRYSAQLEVVVFGVLFVVILQKARAGIVPMINRYLPRPRFALPAHVPPLARRVRPIVSGQPVLTIQGATKRFGALAAVNDVSFEVKGGEVLGLIGPNGAGKSTLLNLITGTAKPNAGRIMFLDHDVTKLAPRHIAARGVARTFQHVKLRPNMTLLDNALLGTYSRTRSGFPRSQRRKVSAVRGFAAAEARRPWREGRRTRGQSAAGSTASSGSRARAGRRPRCGYPGRAGSRPAQPREASSVSASAQLAQRGHDNRSGRARHGIRHEPRRPNRRDGFRFEARGRCSRRYPRRAACAGSLSWRCRMTTTLLSVTDLHVSYGKVEAVSGVSLEMQAGNIVTVIGPNGAGKTTLLAALMGLLPSRGESWYEAQDLRILSTEERVRRGICLVPERRELFTEMTVADNLVLGAYTRWRDRDAVQRDLQEVYRRFPRLSERRSQLAGTLSGGERQMLALGRALMAKPRLLLLDEPSLGLAPLIVREIFRIVMGLRELGVSILLVEQNARAALETADYGYVLETGCIVHTGPAVSLIHDPRVIASYLGGKVN